MDVTLEDLRFLHGQLVAAGNYFELNDTLTAHLNLQENFRYSPLTISVTEAAQRAEYLVKEAYYQRAMEEEERTASMSDLYEEEEGEDDPEEPDVFQTLRGASFAYGNTKNETFPEEDPED